MYFLNRNDDNWLWWTEFVNSPYTISIAMSMTFLILMFVSYKLFVRFCDNKNFKNYIYIYTALTFFFISPLLFYFFNNNLNIKSVYYIFIIFGCIELLYFYFIPIILKLIQKFPKLKSIFKLKKSKQNNIQ